MSRKRRRTLTVGSRRYLWWTDHRHRDGACAEVLQIRRLGAAAGVTLVFAPGEGRYVADGGTCPTATVSTPAHHLNLNLPGVVRALLDTAEDAGWLLDSTPIAERDGWELFDAAHTAYSATRRPCITSLSHGTQILVVEKHQSGRRRDGPE
ncbi:hypothetical protein [Nocardia callitridis]|uniref:Uncharacterized protein n=1 Tax=Nocardia callitridis TaxID=648753 RepID=A0ABP9KBD6_9NOCA